MPDAVAKALQVKEPTRFVRLVLALEVYKLFGYSSSSHDLGRAAAVLGEATG